MVKEKDSGKKWANEDSFYAMKIITKDKIHNEQDIIHTLS